MVIGVRDTSGMGSRVNGALCDVLCFRGVGCALAALAEERLVRARPLATHLVNIVACTLLLE